jgi:hypothetical protein
MIRTAAAIVAVALLAACQDSMPSLEPVSGPSFHISEARFGGGNADLFFAAPLATTPQPGDDKFDVGGANRLLVPHVRICETEGEPTPLGCRNDVTLQLTGSAVGLPMVFIAATELYQVELETDAFVPGRSYRIEIWGLAFSTAAEKASLDPRWLFGWRDVVNAPSTSNCTGAEAFCPIRYGQNIPVRVRIEQSVFCPTTKNCAVQFVTPGANANLEAQLNPATGAPSAQLFIPAQAGTNFAVAFEPCTAAEDAAVSNAIDLPTFGPCVKTVSLFTGTLGTPAIVSLCDNLDPTGFGLAHSQEHQLALHHFRADLSKVTALPEVWQCIPPTSGTVASAPRRGVLRLASLLGQTLRSWMTPRPLYASAALIDRGGGGQTSDFGSFFKLALPGKFEYVNPGDGEQSGVAGSPLTLRVKVTDLFGDAVRNARVRWRAIVPPNDAATVLGTVPPGPTLTNAQGIAQATAQLASAAGRNVFYAFGRGIADNRATGCTVPPGTSAACNGPRTVYDPFLPFHVPEFDPVGPELPVDIAENTRIRFGVNACAAGRGSAVIDGNFSSAEWACATTYSFSAETPTGLTPATLYVMNDASRLYLAVRLQRRPIDKVLSLQFNFDNNNSWKTSGTGAGETGDDVLALEAGKGFTDAYLTLACTSSTQASCWKSDVTDGGTKDGSGAFKNDGTFTTYEIAHPLNTADNARDFSLSLGNNVGLFLTMASGGNAGVTVWPAFRQYQEIRITP